VSYFHSNINSCHSPQALPPLHRREKRKASFKIILLSCLGFLIAGFLALLVLAFIASQFLASPVALYYVLSKIGLVDLPGTGTKTAAVSEKLANLDSADFVIDQKDDYVHHFNISAAGPMDINLGADSSSVVFSFGLPEGRAKTGEPAWKTDWEVYQDSILSSNSDFSVFAEYRDAKSYYLLDLPARNITGSGADQTVLTFSLKGVREGGTFPVRSTRISDSVYQNTGADQTWRHIIQNETTNYQYSAPFDPDSTQTYLAGSVFNYTGTLVKDNGDQGAVIQLEANEETKSQLREAYQATNNLAPLRQHMDSVTQMEMDKIYNGDLGIKPLRIVPNTT
jgi:hypothetical protein